MKSKNKKHPKTVNYQTNSTVKNLSFFFSYTASSFIEEKSSCSYFLTRESMKKKKSKEPLLAFKDILILLIGFALNILVVIIQYVFFR